VTKFKYLGVDFSSDGRQGKELMDTRIGKASLVMRALQYVVFANENCRKKQNSKPNQLLSPFSPRSCVLGNYNDRKNKIATPEMRFLRRIEGATLFDKVRSSEIRKSLNINSQFLLIERSQLSRWFGFVSRMPQERLLKQALIVKVKRNRPVGRSRIRKHWQD